MKKTKLNIDLGEGRSAAVLLVDAFPQISSMVAEAFPSAMSTSLFAQLQTLAVDKQILGGNRQFFTFSTTPLPPLTPDQARLLDYGEEKTIELQFGQGRLRIDIDGFGRMVYFYVYDIPDLYDSLANYLSTWPGGQSTEELQQHLKRRP